MLSSSTVVVGIGISLVLTLLSMLIQYSLMPKGGIVKHFEALLHRGETVLPLRVDVNHRDPAFEFLGSAQVSYVAGAAKYLTEHLERRHPCDYCKTIQNVGAHCLNCGAPLE